MSFSKLRSSSLRLYPLTSLLFSCFAIFMLVFFFFFFFSSRRRHTRLVSDWSSDVCSSDLHRARGPRPGARGSRRPPPRALPRRPRKARGGAAPRPTPRGERRGGGARRSPCRRRFLRRARRRACSSDRKSVV